MGKPREYDCAFFSPLLLARALCSVLDIDKTFIYDGERVRLVSGGVALIMPRVLSCFIVGKYEGIRDNRLLHWLNFPPLKSHHLRISIAIILPPILVDSSMI